MSPNISPSEEPRSAQTIASSRYRGGWPHRSRPIPGRARTVRSFNDRRGSTVIVNRNNFIFYQPYRQIISYREIRPESSFLISFSLGSRVSFRLHYPYHHIRYLFVNPHGYWPTSYNYTRYYWYGIYPYAWQGYNPIPSAWLADHRPGQQINHYHYYYGDLNQFDPQAIDETALADIHADSAPPPSPSLADLLFDDAVTHFEQEEYDLASTCLARAMSLEPEDKILPFAYVQAKFADGRYALAAQALRQALTMVEVEHEGIFFPRGLYPSDEILFNQIEALAWQLQQEETNTDLKLLLGYQLLGLGEYSDAASLLGQATGDPINGNYAWALLKLLTNTVES